MRYLFLLLVFSILFSCTKENTEREIPDKLSITYVYIGEASLSETGNVENIVLNEPVEIRFDKPVNIQSLEENVFLLDSENQVIEVDFQYFNQNRLIKITHPDFDEGTSYKLSISGDLKGDNNESFEGQIFTFTTLISPLIIESVFIDGIQYNQLIRILDINRNPELELHFNSAIDKNDLLTYSSFSSNGEDIGFNLNQKDEKTISITFSQTLTGYSKNSFNISSGIENRIGKPFDGFDLDFYAELDSSYKFPEISDEELLTLIQEQTFKYFWDLANPVSGLMRERYRSTDPDSDNITIGGSGFGVMAIIVGIERGFITRQEGIDRLEKITNFLEQQADIFHGVWPHWMSGSTGEVHPFSSTDDGADLVETSFMIQGLLTVRQYLNSTNTQEAAIIATINRLWHAVEWDWFKQDGDDALTWHWSPNHGYSNLFIRGWNEALIVYVLAASSPTHTISKDTYSNGWAKNGNIANSGNTYFGYTLPLRTDMGGPLFFTHYSFLGLDPRNLEDQFANYWIQNVTHAKINHAYCAENALNFVGYSDKCWGLTASDGFSGYSAHSPNNDRGVIAPTAAVASIPYTPEESMAAIRHFYYILGDKLWGEYGFRDAFDFTNSWVDADNIGIDQGPQIIMIENYRTGLLWDLFMSCPEVQEGLSKLGFTF